MSGSGPYNHILGSWQQTGFTSGCPASSTYGTWVGLGGASQKTNGLIQIGTFSDPNNLTGLLGFWEVVPSPPVFFNYAMSPGDKLNAEIYYDPPAPAGSGGTTGRAVMQLIDVTKATRFPVTVSSVPVGGQASPVSAFYDGKSAEWITERAAVVDPSTGKVNGFTPLRKPTLGSTYWNQIDNYAALPPVNGNTTTYYVGDVANNATTPGKVENENTTSDGLPVLGTTNHYIQTATGVSPASDWHTYFANCS